jgi:hypothetical protein
MFVTLKVFKLIGPSNDGRRHGRGTYLFLKKSVLHDRALEPCLNVFRNFALCWMFLQIDRATDIIPSKFPSAQV